MTQNKIALLVSGLLAMGLGQAQAAQGEEVATSYAIPAGQLANALNQFAQASRINLAFSPSLTQGLTTKGLQGSYTPAKGLRQLLAGHNLRLVAENGTYSIRSAQDTAATGAGNIEDVIVIGSRQVNPSPGRVYLDKEQLERYRGTGNGDVFQGISGVQVNSLRNEAGALDIGIRGVQGEGRVPVYIDGSLQSTHTFRGYQGESDRTYVDMDLISSVVTDKGASASKYGTGAIGGLVQMKTLGVDDILLPGQSYGVLLKGSLFNNNKTPNVPSDERGQQSYALSDGQKSRHFKNGAFTVGFAYQDERFDFVTAYNHRKVGNYFAGKKGRDRFNPDQAMISPGQEVVNTSYESDSGIAKLGINLTDSQRLELNFRRHLQKAGEVLSFYWFKSERPDGDHMPQWMPGSARVSASSVEHRYQPADNPLINLTTSFWQTKAKMHQYNGLSMSPGAMYGNQYLGSAADDRHGLNIQNISVLSSLPLTLNYGVTLDQQRMQPRNLYQRESSRDAKREEQSMFLNLNYAAAVADVNLNGRLHKGRITDFNGSKLYQTTDTLKYDYHTKFDWLGHLAVHLDDHLDVFAQYSNSYRNPSLFEGSSSNETFSFDWHYPLKPENARSYELGFKGQYQNLINNSDRLTFKANYFHNDIKNFVTAGTHKSAPGAAWWASTSYTFVNYNRFLMKGYELSLAYDSPRFFIDANATLYNKPKICPDSANVCSEAGGEWSLIPARIAPKRLLNLAVGAYFLDRDLSVGARLRYHSAKHNPKGWLNGTGISGRAVEEIPAEKIVDLFAKYKVNKHAEVTVNVDNLTNRYTFDPGTVIGMPMPGRTVKMGLSMRF